MLRLAFLALPFVLPTQAVANPFADARTAALIARLGSDDYFEREAATERLGSFGDSSLPRLRAAAKSPNPEVARRASNAFARIEWRLENERTLAPTIVNIQAKDRKLDEVLKDFSKQSSYRVFPGPQRAAELGERTISLKTGPVPFWTAVLRICDAAELEIESVDCSYPPGVVKPIRKYELGTISLQPRGLRKRPASVHGAVLVEALEAPDGRSTLLQVWPEPKLNWQTVKGTVVRSAIDDRGQLLKRLPFEPMPEADSEIRLRAGIKHIPAKGAPPPNGQIRTQGSQYSVLHFQPGPQPSQLLKDLSGTIHGVIRAPTEALVSVVDLKPGEAGEVTRRGVKLRASIQRTTAGDWQADVELTYDESSIQYQDGDLPARSLMGVRAGDADGSSFRVKLISFTDYRHDGSRCTRRAMLALEPREGNKNPPTHVSFWGIGNKSVDVPFALRNVPFPGG